MLLMDEILQQFLGSLSHYLKGFLYIPGGAGFLPTTVCVCVRAGMSMHMSINIEDISCINKDVAKTKCVTQNIRKM